MRFEARFGPEARERAIAVDGEAPAIDVALDAGGPARWDVRAVSPGVFSVLAPDGRQTLVSVRRSDEGARAHVDGRAIAFDLVDALTARARAAGGRRGGAVTGDVKAAIPGRVLRLLVRPGDEVAAGQTLLVLEAMKMENEVRSPREGRVRSVEVESGKPVGAGDVLVRFER